MIVVDVNVCLYAHDASSPCHEAAHAWLRTALNGLEPVRFPWTTIVGFRRVATSHRVLESPLSVEQAAGVVDVWLEAPAGGIVEPTERHWRVLRDLMVDSDARGPLVPDAHLAALAIEHGATLATTDRDFRRFLGLRLLDPTASA